MVAILRFGERVAQTEEDPHGWRTLFSYWKGKEQPDSLLGQKSVICFTGDGSINPEELNGYCKNVAKMLTVAGVSPQDMPHVYALGFDVSSTNDTRMQAFNEVGEVTWRWRSKSNSKGQATDKYANYPQVFFDTYFKPLLFDENNQPRSQEEIQKNLQNITIVTHCHGSVFAYNMEKIFAQELSKIYPKDAKALLGNLRMIHFASRKPINAETFGKHLHVVSGHGDADAVDPWVAYNSIHKALHRLDMKRGSSALLPVSKTEDILLVERFVGAQLDDNYDDHEHFMNVFASREKKAKMSESALSSVSMTQKLLRHFVEHPEDSKSIPEILAEIDPQWTSDNISRGRELMDTIHEECAVDAGILSLLGKFPGSIGRLHTNVKGKKDRKQKENENEKRYYLFQEDSEGKILYERVKEEYLKTGDARSIINLIKVSGFYLPPPEAMTLMSYALKTKNWALCRTITKSQMFMIEDIKPVLHEALPEALVHLMPLMKKTYGLDQEEELVTELIKKSTRIKNGVGRLSVQTYLKSVQDKIEERKKRQQGFSKSNGMDSR